MKGLWAIPRQVVGACQVDVSLRKFLSYFWGIFKHNFSLNGAFLWFFFDFSTGTVARIAVAQYSRAPL